MNKKEKEPAVPVPDCILSNGTEVFFDKHQITPREWRDMQQLDRFSEEVQQTIAKFAKLDFEMVASLDMQDWDQLLTCAFKVAYTPARPN